jgi:hypothetical protein
MGGGNQAYRHQCRHAQLCSHHLGLPVEVGRFLVDVPRTTSVTRYFLARRYAGGDGLGSAGGLAGALG